MVGGGLIVRAKVQKDSFVELNWFFDGLRDDGGFSYPQLGAGLGFTHSWITVRANGYLPLRDADERTVGHRHWTTVERSLTGRVTEIDWSEKEIFQRAPMRGFDAEVEIHSPKRLGWIEPSVAVGYYYRQTDDRPELYSGIMVRGELQFGEHWKLAGEYRNDASAIDQEWRVSIQYQHFFGEPKARTGETISTQMLGPAVRSPWPTVARGEASRGPREGDDHHWESSSSSDCCNSGDEPLIFE